MRLPALPLRRPSFQRGLRVVAHVAAWLAVAFVPLAFSPLPGGPPPPGFSVWRMLIPMSLLAGFFYLNYWVLIPRLLALRRFGWYFGVVALIGAVFLLPLVLARLGFVVPPPGSPKPENPFQLISLVVGLVWVISSALRITGEWFRSEQLRRQLRSDHLAAELAFLKAQVNPHFLFNTLNNIYSLAELKSDDAPAAILQLAALMRYMLYEADAPRVPLAREVEYLHHYIELQRLRLDPGQVPITFTVEGNLGGLLIEPMLLLPFVENAFKHGISSQHSSAIGVLLRATATALLFRVQNRRFLPATLGAEPAGGVGLQNVTQRLRLLYPDRHRLDIQPSPDSFVVSLTLQLTSRLPDDPLPDRGR